MPQEDVSQVDPYAAFNSELGKIWEAIVQKAYQDEKEEEGLSFSPPSPPSVVAPEATSSTVPVLAFDFEIFREDWQERIIELAQKRYGYAGKAEEAVKRSWGEVDTSGSVDTSERKKARR
jgi:hypothetical protein